MGGDTARKGFLFQDNYLLLRLLEEVSESLESEWERGSQNGFDVVRTSSSKFGIEASPNGNSGATESAFDWDVLVLGGSKLEFAEVKSGAIKKDDRLTFWRRVRRELNRTSGEIHKLVPILVVDPDKSDTLEKWNELAQEAEKFSAAPPSQEPTGNVLKASQLLQEALWFICRPDDSTDGSNPPADSIIAIKALKRFELHCHEAEKLESQVAKYIELLFPNGLTDTQENLLLGWLNKRATSPEPDRRLFSPNELLGEIGILQYAESLTSGILKKWRNLWDEVPSGVRARTRFSLGKNGAVVPALLVQPAAVGVLDSGTNRSLVILGAGGAGKSTFLAQSVEAAEQRGDRVLYCGAGDVDISELDLIADAIRFVANLTNLRRPEKQLLLYIDGLDEADSVLRKRWVQVLVRYATLSNVKIVVSVRDALWRTDGSVRAGLEPWPVITLKLWPEPVISDLLDATLFKSALPPTVIELLRTPILLDLFWRTFVEVTSPDVSRASRLQTKHNLLAEFWHERLLASPRHSKLYDIVSRIHVVMARAAASVGEFSEADLDIECVETLLSEGVLVREGKLRPRLRFRHPLLRDFALAQWCLESNDSAELAKRWNSIQGGLQRHGCLRSIFEALSDPNASFEYPKLTLGGVVQAIVVSDPNLSSQVAHILGAREPVPSLDPAGWTHSVQSVLPAAFARDILSFAQLDGNAAWVPVLEKWPDNVQWLNKDYPKIVWKFAEALAKESAAKPDDITLPEYSRQAARKLRALSEVPRFAEEFEASERWLKTQAFLSVIPILPDQATLEWVQREMPQSNWRTRSFLLGKLVYLAQVDADATAILYRQAVGLTEQHGRPHIDPAIWRGNMDRQAIEWSLVGEGSSQGLLRKYPESFLPVALDLAEALWILKRDDPNHRGMGIAELIGQFDSTLDSGAQARENERQLKLGELIDDSPDWRYWRSFPSNDPYDRCLAAITKCIDHLAEYSPSTFETNIGRLRSSRLASIQMILFDAAIKFAKNSGSAAVLRDNILDSRLYYIFGFEYWIEQGLVVAWGTLLEGDRAKVFDILRALLGSVESEEDAKHYLARLPENELPDDLKAERPHEGDAAYQARKESNRSAFDFNGEWLPVKSNEPEIMIGEWSEDFDRDLILDFAQLADQFSKEGISIEERREAVMAAIEKVKALVPALLGHVAELEEASRYWMWRRLTEMFSVFRSTRQTEADQPNSEVVAACAELALKILERIPSDLPGELPSGDVWMGYRESCWGLALCLADEVLTWQPAASNHLLQGRFVNVIKAAYETENPLIQLVCAVKIRSWHWLRTPERKYMHDELIWSRQKHPSVLAWSFSLLRNRADVDRARIVRLLLSRADLNRVDHLADRLGQTVGAGGMVVFSNGARSAVADVARDVVRSHQEFRFLGDVINRNSFFRSFIFGMKEQAKLVSISHPELAPDYGEWALKVWMILRTQREERNVSEGVILLAMYWLGKHDREGDVAQLKLWWIHLQALFTAVILDGDRPDCFTLLFQLRKGEYNDLALPEEILGLIRSFAERVRKGALVGAMDLDERVPDDGGCRSWRECCEYSAETVDSLIKDGSLQGDLQLEMAHGLLSILAAEPIRSSNAVMGLHRLQTN